MMPTAFGPVLPANLTAIWKINLRTPKQIRKNNKQPLISHDKCPKVHDMANSMWVKNVATRPPKSAPMSV